MCRAAAVRKAFINARVGSVGGSFDGMGDFFVDPPALQQSIGAEVVYMDPPVAKQYVDAVSSEEVDAEIVWENEHFSNEISDQENYRKAVLSGLAVRKWGRG